MPNKVEQTPLVSWLTRKDPRLVAKALDLRATVGRWLSYVPQTFPHYTSHTIDHSDEIILQVSKLLFPESRKTPVVDLSAAEGYVLMASAFLHDSGMVTPDGEKRLILSSDEWKQWTTGSGGGAKRWREIEEFRRTSRVPESEAERHFIADVQTRYLIAEFVRQRHHFRAANVIQAHRADLGFANDERAVSETVAQVCVAHGLDHFALQDNKSFPDRLNILDQEVNVRFLAILLRLGDLLDMRFDRACPLLLNAACPLPADSLAHWTQYGCITQRLTAPDVIRITAECENQEEHRNLQDWCQWLVDETNHSAALMAHAARHGNWKPPLASLSGDSPTIVIRPANPPTYIPSRWNFHLDAAVVFERLISDVYDEPTDFIRELLQNALDANRCRMYMDLGQGISPPESPTGIDPAHRAKYPVRITLKTETVANQLSGDSETKQVLIVEDCGIGMDSHVIERYLLQVGRSYYTTDEFLRKFRFYPSSRFGIGFLSVFAVSDLVRIQTYRPESREGPLKLTLTGPRNYLLKEKGDLVAAGTRVEVVLNRPLQPGEMTRAIRRWCLRVELPLIVDELGEQSTVAAERPADLLAESPDPENEGARYLIRAFPIDRRGIEGEVYFLAWIDSQGRESWAASYKAAELSGHHVRARNLRLPEPLVCLNGIVVDTGSPVRVKSNPDGSATVGGPRIHFRADYRGAPLRVNLSRKRSSDLDEEYPELKSRVYELIREHLDRQSSRGGLIEYKQELALSYPDAEFWFSDPALLRVRKNGVEKAVSAKDLAHGDAFYTVEAAHADLTKVPLDPAALLLLPGQLRGLPEEIGRGIFDQHGAASVISGQGDTLFIEWRRGSAEPVTFLSEHMVALAPLPQETPMGIDLRELPRSAFSGVLLNTKHPVVRWLLNLRRAHDVGQRPPGEQQLLDVRRAIVEAVVWHGSDSKLKGLLKSWQAMHLPGDLIPPDFPLAPSSDRGRGRTSARRRRRKN